MDNKDLAIECITSTYERIIKRLWVLIIIIFVTCAASNFGWIIYNSQFETVERTEVKQESETGTNNYIGNDGDITNGQTDDNKN